MKTIIAGSRTITNYRIVVAAIKKIDWEITTIISGCANGVDKLGEQWARENNIPIQHFPAEWERHGKSAGFIRNKKMADEANAVIAIWDGKSAGTAHMINIAKHNNLKLKILIVKRMYWNE